MMHERIAARRQAIAEKFIMRNDSIAVDTLRLVALQAYNAHLSTGIPAFETLGDALQNALREMDRLSPFSKEGLELRDRLVVLMMTFSKELHAYANRPTHENTGPTVNRYTSPVFADGELA